MTVFPAVTKDSAWSWVICFVAFVSHFLTIGFTYSIGLYYVEFLHEFNHSKGTTAWISALNFGGMSLSGPLGSFMIYQWGLRVTLFTGGLTSALGLFVTSFATNIYVVFLFFGCVAGIGSGVAYAVSVVLMSVYFQKYRNIALGLSLSGIGVGNMCFPWITISLIDIYTWRGALIISSGLVLHVSLASMLILSPRQKAQKPAHSKLDNCNVLKVDANAVPPVSKTENGIAWVTNRTLKANNAVQTSKADLDGKDAVKQRHTVINNQQADNATSAQNCEEECSNSASRKELKNHSESEGKQDSMKKQTVQLFSNRHFVIFFANIVTAFFGLGVFYTHVASFGELQGVSSFMRSVLVSVTGAGSTTGRVALGMLTQQAWTNATAVYSLALFLTGICMIMFAVWTSTVGMLICSCCLGFFSATVGPSLAEVGCLICGQELFNFGHGYIMVAHGAGWLLGAPAAGFLYDWTQFYPNSFYLGGGVTMVGALMMIPTAVISQRNNWEVEKKEKPNHGEKAETHVNNFHEKTDDIFFITRL